MVAINSTIQLSRTDMVAINSTLQLSRTDMVAINSTLQLLVVVHHKWTIHLRIPFKIFSDLPSPETSISITATSQDMTSLGSTHELSQSRLLNSTISMVSSIQGAFSSLQSSKNNLVNKHSSSATTNCLEQYFSAQTDQGSGSSMLQTSS